MKILKAKNNDVNIEYIWYLIQNMKYAPSTHKRHYISIFEPMKIILPCKWYQDIVVDLLKIIQYKFTIIQSAQSNIKQVGDLLKYKILNSIFNENSNYKSYYEHKEDKLSNLCSLITKGSTPTTYGFEYLSSGINFIKVENVSNYKVKHESITQFISNEAHNFQKRSQLVVNDMLISIAGTLGKICLISNKDLPANTNQAFAIIRGYTNSLFPEYLKWYLTWYVESKSQNIGHGGGMNNLTLAEIKNLNISYPNKSHQQKIVTYINNCMKHIETLLK